MSCNLTPNLSIDELIKAIDGQKTRALVDKKYVEPTESEIEGNLFDYDIDFNRFLEDMEVIFKGIKDG